MNSAAPHASFDTAGERTPRLPVDVLGDSLPISPGRRCSSLGTTLGAMKPSRVTKRSVSLPTDLVVLAKNAGLVREEAGGLSGLLARLLDGELDRLDDVAYGRMAPQDLEEIAGSGDAFARLHWESLSAEDRAGIREASQPSTRAAG
jgi:hypothetical protein